MEYLLFYLTALIKANSGLSIGSNKYTRLLDLTFKSVK